MKRDVRIPLSIAVGAMGVLVTVVMTVAVPALLGLEPHERRINRYELIVLGIPVVSALVWLIAREAMPLARWQLSQKDELRSDARRAAALLPDNIARFGGGLGGAAIVAGSAIELWYGMPLSTVLPLALVDATALGAGLVPLVVFARNLTRPMTLALADESLPAGGPLVSMRTKVTGMVLALGVLGIVPPAIIGASRTIAAADHLRQKHDLEQALAVAADSPSLTIDQIRARMNALPRGIVLDDRAPAPVRRVETLVALGPPHAGWSIGFLDGSGPSQALGGAVILTMLSLLAITFAMARGLARRLSSDVRRVRTKIEELARGELGDPLSRAQVHSTELRELTLATNQLLVKMSDINVGRFLAIERAGEADRTKTQFFANMSHDLRSPLTSILGFAELLVKEMEGPLNAQQRDSLTCIRTLGEHVLALVGEILDWARVSAGGLELHMTWTPAAELLREGAREAAQKLPRDVTLDADPAAGLPQMLLDRARTAQAIGTFTSLVGNFIRRGRISLSARGGDAPGIGPALQIVIEPSASMPPDEANRGLTPFEPWPGDGLGLALPLARRIVELQGGRAEVTEGDNQRAAFVLSLPVGQTVHRRTQARQGRN